MASVRGILNIQSLNELTYEKVWVIVNWLGGGVLAAAR